MREASSFLMKLREIRDNGLSPAESACLRYKYLDIWAVMPYEHLTADDLEWLLIAGAMHPEVATLRIHFRMSTGQDPLVQFCFLCDDLDRHRFNSKFLSYHPEKHFLTVPLYSPQDNISAHDLIA